MAVQSWVLVNHFTSQLHAERNSHCWWASVKEDYTRAKGSQLPSLSRVVVISFCHLSPSTIFLPFAFLSLGFPGGSAGKESACNAGDLGSIPELGRSPGRGHGNPLQYRVLENSMDCVIHRVAKCWEDTLGKEMATHSCTLAWKIPWMEETVGYSPWDHRVGHNWATSLVHWFFFLYSPPLVFHLVLGFPTIMSILLKN